MQLGLHKSISRRIHACYCEHIISDAAPTAQTTTQRRAALFDIKHDVDSIIDEFEGTRGEHER